MAYKLLIINPGSTSTKIGVYEDEKEVFVETLRHSSDEIAKYDSIFEQKEFRKSVIMNVLKENNFDVNTLDAVVGRGGMLKPIPGGTYEVNDTLLNDLKVGVQGEHASNLGGILANEIAKEVGGRAFIVDPVVVDELEPVARISGVPELPRKSKFHALNQKAIARRAAKQLNRKYDESNFIVIHIGGGISIGAHEKGKVIDVNNVIDGDGPMAPTRAGSIPVEAVIDLCFSGKYTRTELKEYVSQRAGLTDYLGTSDVRDVQEMMEQGNEQAKMLYEAMAYQICKNVGAMATVLKGKIDAIVVTGGVAYSKQFVRLLKERIDFLGEVIVIPGEEEMLALAEGALRVLTGEEEAKTI